MKRLMWPALTESMTLPATLSTAFLPKPTRTVLPSTSSVEAWQFKCFVDDWAEVFAFYVWDAWEADWSCGEDVAAVAFHGALDAVGRHQDGAWECCEFFLLVLPCGAVVAVEVGVLFESGVAVGWKHFAVGVDVDVFALGLF